MRQVFLFTVLIFPSMLMAMADVSQAPIYGVPTLYGEYEVTSDDVRQAGQMYGDASVRVQPIRASVDKPVAKQPVKAAKVKKKSVKKAKAVKKVAPAPAEKKATAKVDAAPALEKMPEAVPEKVEVVEMAPVQVNPMANVIADAVAENIVDVDAFCTQRKPLHAGKLPDGLILMPGRPDLMSCTIK